MILQRFHLDDPGWHGEVCSGRFCKGFILTILGSMRRFALDDSVKVFVLDDAGQHGEICSGRFRKGFSWTIRGSTGRFAPDDVLNVLYGQFGVTCRGLFHTIL